MTYLHSRLIEQHRLFKKKGEELKRRKKDLKLKIKKLSLNPNQEVKQELIKLIKGLIDGLRDCLINGVVDYIKYFDTLTSMKPRVDNVVLQTQNMYKKSSPILERRMSFLMTEKESMAPVSSNSNNLMKTIRDMEDSDGEVEGDNEVEDGKSRSPGNQKLKASFPFVKRNLNKAFEEQFHSFRRNDGDDDGGSDDQVEGALRKKIAKAEDMQEAEEEIVTPVTRRCGPAYLSVAAYDKDKQWGQRNNTPIISSRIRRESMINSIPIPVLESLKKENDKDDSLLHQRKLAMDKYDTYGKFSVSKFKIDPKDQNKENNQILDNQIKDKSVVSSKSKQLINNLFLKSSSTITEKMSKLVNSQVKGKANEKKQSRLPTKPNDEEDYQDDYENDFA